MKTNRAVLINRTQHESRLWIDAFESYARRTYHAVYRIEEPFDYPCGLHRNVMRPVEEAVRNPVVPQIMVDNGVDMYWAFGLPRPEPEPEVDSWE